MGFNIQALFNMPLRNWLWAGNLLLLLMVGYSLGAMAARFVESTLVAAMPPPKSNAVSGKAVRAKPPIPVASFENILTDNIFKAERQEASSAETLTDNAENPGISRPSSLDLVLTGVFIFGESGFAMVSEKDKRKEKVYKLGQCLPEPADERTKQCNPSQGKLVKLFARSIYVQYGAELLSFKITDESRKKPARTARTTRPAPRKPRAMPQIAGTGFPSEANGNNVEMRVPRGEVDKAFENFSDVLKQARVVPFSGQGLKGFQIRRIQPGSIFQKIGLRNMDVIRSVNGESIASADQALKLMTVFRNERQVVLDISRQNKSMTLSYVIE